jgi:transposase
MNYQEAITEKAEDLIKSEKATKDLKGRDRIRFLRLLKTGEATSQKQAGNMIGLKIRQSQRLWQRYQSIGLDEFVKSRYEGRTGKLTEKEKTQLEERLKKDDFKSLKEAQRYLAQEFGATYTIGGVSYLFQQMKIKLKTGRPHNYRQNKEEAEDFKKNTELG